MPAERTIGNYVLGPILGRGGMSEVYAAAHRFLGDPVAIKLLHAHVARTPGAAAAFLAEATRTRSIEHPNVVRVLDFGVDGDACYLVMERLAGESLAARLDRAGPLDEPALRALGAALADGLAAAHDRGIVHRDLKPANVVLAAVPKIVDFGIARELAAAGAKTTGSRVGTLAYMAPEQLAGGLVAPCVDVWALGVLLFEACTGALPFAELRDGLAPQLVDAAPRLGARASAALDALVAACLERDPRRRPASMRAIAAALRAHPSAERFTEDLGATTQVTDEAGAHVGAPRSAGLDRGAGAARVTEDLGLAASRLANEVDAHVGAAPRSEGLDRHAGAARVTEDLGVAASRMANEVDAHVGAAPRSAGLDRGAGAARVTEDLGLA
ncbi:MAG TPA: serine/threonine-protein kinase, partial [Kofleriaceae bacterium]|nr:serine/threonine-protein kinase [Kofleriaceae bacterium]